jgi:hypothetical protein
VVIVSACTFDTVRSPGPITAPDSKAIAGRSAPP